MGSSGWVGTVTSLVPFGESGFDLHVVASLGDSLPYSRPRGDDLGHGRIHLGHAAAIACAFDDGIGDQGNRFAVVSA